MKRCLCILPILVTLLSCRESTTQTASNPAPKATSTSDASRGASAPITLHSKLSALPELDIAGSNLQEYGEMVWHSKYDEVPVYSPTDHWDETIFNSGGMYEHVLDITNPMMLQFEYSERGFYSVSCVVFITNQDEWNTLSNAYPTKVFHTDKLEFLK